MIKLFTLILLAGCATPQSSVPASARIKEKKFSTAQEARHFVRNKWNYLFLLFEQSYDPYYGKPKWPEDCLKKNHLGKVEEKNGNTFFRAQFLLNEKDEPGNCSGDSADLFWLHCGDETSVKEIICSPGRCDKLLDGNPCPL